MSEEDFDFEGILGKKAKDSISNVEGTVTGYAVYLAGLPRCEITNKENPTGIWFDIARVDFLE